MVEKLKDCYKFIVDHKTDGCGGYLLEITLCNLGLISISYSQAFVYFRLLWMRKSFSKLPSTLWGSTTNLYLLTGMHTDLLAVSSSSCSSSNSTSSEKL